MNAIGIFGNLLCKIELIITAIINIKKASNNNILTPYFFDCFILPLSQKHR